MAQGLHLSQRLTQSLSSRFVVVHREVLHRSPILLTPYRPDGLIDVLALERFVHAAYAEAGLTPDQIDLRFDLRHVLAPLGEHARTLDYLCAAEALAEPLGDP